MKTRVKLILIAFFFIANLALCILCLVDISKGLFQQTTQINPVMDIGLGIVFLWNAIQGLKGIKKLKS